MVACDLTLLERWLTGWSRSRGLPLPYHDGGGLTVEVGLPDQLRRHVFADAGPALQARAEAIHTPSVYLKAPVHARPQTNELEAFINGAISENVALPDHFPVVPCA
jgi:hypothetical protein